VVAGEGVWRRRAVCDRIEDLLVVDQLPGERTRRWGDHGIDPVAGGDRPVAPTPAPDS